MPETVSDAGGEREAEMESVSVGEVDCVVDCESVAETVDDVEIE